ncbi:MAG: UvrB/UvrC motif-containing protein, partial [Caldiserica bacterium]|nr:UvrB/UvrC motif-containing protein [Caldisericota bacterium]
IDLPWKKDEEVEEINFKDLTEEQFRALITELEEEMHLKAEVLDFEEAIKIRDRIDKLIENYRGKK